MEEECRMPIYMSCVIAREPNFSQFFDSILSNRRIFLSTSEANWKKVNHYLITLYSHFISEVVLSLLLLSINTMTRYLAKGNNDAEYSHIVFRQKQRQKQQQKQ